MRKLLVFVVGLMTALTLSLGMVGSVGVGAVDLNPGVECGDVDCGDEDVDGEDTLENRIPVVVTAILWIVGVLAVGMMMYAAIRMVMSQGNPAKVAQERQTIIYTVVGLIITILAYAIVSFIADKLGGGE